MLSMHVNQFEAQSTQGSHKGEACQKIKMVHVMLQSNLHLVHMELQIVIWLSQWSDLVYGLFFFLTSIVIRLEEKKMASFHLKKFKTFLKIVVLFSFMETFCFMKTKKQEHEQVK